MGALHDLQKIVFTRKKQAPVVEEPVPVAPKATRTNKTKRTDRTLTSVS